MAKTKSAPLIITIVIAVASLAIGYVLGACFGFGKKSSWVGTYTSEVWSGHERVSLVLREDGSCKLPKKDFEQCSYVVKNGYVYFNGEETSTTAIGETGLVYADTAFSKLK